MRVLLVLIVLVICPNIALGQPIKVSIESDVNDKGQVELNLTIENKGSYPVFHIHPMFHFHHSMSMMTTIRELGPGQKITLENDQHPPVLRVGTYPISAMVKYETVEGKEKKILHSGSFYFKETCILFSQRKIESSVLYFYWAEFHGLKLKTLTFQIKCSLPSKIQLPFCLW